MFDIMMHKICELGEGIGFSHFRTGDIDDMNTLKTFFLLIVLTMLLLMVGGIMGGEAGIVIALFFALAMNFGAYWFSDRIALRMTKAHPISEEDDPDLYRLVEEQAYLAGLPMPKVYEIESNSPNAFATGRNPKNATVAVTTGIRQLLNRDELGAVMAHEMAHVGNLSLIHICRCRRAI